MLNSKIYQILSSFSQKERNDILLLCNSSFFSLNDGEQSLLRVLIEKHSSLANIEKEKLFLEAFAEKKFDDQKYRLALSKIYKALERFAIFIEIKTKENKDIKAIALSRYFRRKNLKKLFKNSTKQKSGSEAFYTRPLETQLMMEFENYQFESLEKRNQQLNIQKLLDLSDKNYYAHKLRFACYALSHEAIYTAQYDFKHLDQIVSTIKDSEYLEEPLIAVYFYAYEMLVNPELDQSYLDYKTYLFEHQSFFPIEEKRSLYFFALNRCIQRLNGGDKNYGKEGIEIYQQAIQNKTLLINGFLSRFTYRNVAMMAIRIHDFELGEKLTNEYEVYLRKQDKLSAYHFNKALINYYKKDLDEALVNIMNADFKDHLIHLAAKTLQAKIYYELDQNKTLDYHLDSMEMYIIRNKVLGYHRKNYKNFIKYTKKIVSTNPYNQEKNEMLKNKISLEEVLTEKQWLLDQIK